MTTPVVTTQPGLQSMQLLTPTAATDHGGPLHALMMSRELFIHEERDMNECLFGDRNNYLEKCCGAWLCGCGPPKKHGRIALNAGEIGWKFSEESECCIRHFCSRMRGFEVAITDVLDKVVFKIRRPFSTVGCFCNVLNPAGCYGYYGDSCTQGFRLEVHNPSGEVMGSVEQESSFGTLKFNVLDRNHQIRYRFEAKLTDGFCTNPCFIFPVPIIPGITRAITKWKDIEAKLNDNNGSKVGSINWQFPGIVESAVYWLHKFKIEFPEDADVELRATIVGMAFLLVFLTSICHYLKELSVKEENCFTQDRTLIPKLEQASMSMLASS